MPVACLESPAARLGIDDGARAQADIAGSVGGFMEGACAEAAVFQRQTRRRRTRAANKKPRFSRVRAPGVDWQHQYQVEPDGPDRESQAKLIAGRSSGFRVTLPPRLPTGHPQPSSGFYCGGRRRSQRRVRGRISRPSLLSHSLGHLQRISRVQSPKRLSSAKNAQYDEFLGSEYCCPITDLFA